MSGGVDSSVAVRLLMEQGYELEGVTFKVDSSSGAESAVHDAKIVAEAFGIRHTSLDMSEEFRLDVKEYFVKSYEAGKTPIPCVECNRKIKFGRLLDYALERGFDGIATGHYARLATENGRRRLYRAADAQKDQSYMLAGLTEKQIMLSHFPLGEYTKDEIRRIAGESNLTVSEKKDSQDICFISDGDYVRFLTEYRGRPPAAGKYVDVQGNVLGQNRGQETVTVGQSRGLGIALGKKVYVIERDAAANRVVLGDEEHLYKSEVYCEGINLIGEDGLPDGERLTVKIRYAHRGTPAFVKAFGSGRTLIKFDEPVRAPASGQYAVMYRGDCVVGSAVIE